MAKPKPAETETASKPAEDKTAKVTQAPIEPPKMEAPGTTAAPSTAAGKAAEDAKAKMKEKVEEAAKQATEDEKPALDRDALNAAVAAAAKGEQGTRAEEPSKPKEAAKDATATAVSQVAKVEPSPAAKDAVAASGGYRVQLGSSKLKDRAEAAAQRLNKQHAEILGDARVAAVRADLGDRGIFYRLWAGPFADKGAADALCDKLKARKQGCLTVKR